MADVPWNQDFDHLLRAHCRHTRPEEPIDPDAAFVNLGVDSLGLLSLIEEVESAFTVVFPPDMLTIEVLFSPAGFWQALQLLMDE